MVGTCTFAAGSLGTALLLLAFFISSTLLSRAGKARKKKLVDIGKGGPRDAWQVLANGGVATVCVLVWVLLDHSNASSIWFVAFAGAYAAATADTWGTEIGTLAPGRPRSILTGKPLATGLSGGVSRPGTAAEIAGAVLIAMLTPAALLLAIPGGGLPIDVHVPVWLSFIGIRGALTVYWSTLLLPVFAGGFGGALVDSLIGATLQERRWCPACERECEVARRLVGVDAKPQRSSAESGKGFVQSVGIDERASLPESARTFGMASLRGQERGDHHR